MSENCKHEGKITGPRCLSCKTEWREIIDARDRAHAEQIRKLEAECRKEAYKECARIAESFKFDGDYKDCPAAWVTACYEKFAQAIRAKEEGL